MNKFIISVIVLFSFGFLLLSNAIPVEAKRGGSYYYKSSKTGKFIPKSYYKKHPSTTYKGRR